MEYIRDAVSMMDVNFGAVFFFERMIEKGGRWDDDGVIFCCTRMKIGIKEVGVG